jgi:hypothetical protein
VRYLIGIDDTDNKDSRGTGYNSRQLAIYLEENDLARVKGITRHQLFVHPDIPYTSQNSSACLDVEAYDFNALKDNTRSFMLNVGAEGSDVGLCIASWDSINHEIIDWGESAKKMVLRLDNCKQLADGKEIYLEGLTGTHDGMIGALAAVGLRKSGNDGRFIWLEGSKNIRDIEADVHPISFLTTKMGIDLIVHNNQIIDRPNDRVFLNNWARPILNNNKAMLLVDNEKNNKYYEWKCAEKSIVREASN